MALLGYMQLGVAQEQANSISDVSIYLFEVIFMTHFVGFFISIIGTGFFLQKVGERRSLLLIPLMSGIFLMYFMFSGSSSFALGIALVVLKSINYAIGWPLRESLYIPTVKEIKFKSKSLIDSYGSKGGKLVGTKFGKWAGHFGSTISTSIHSFFFAGLIGAWFLTAFLLGRRFEWAVENNEVIGIDKEDE